MQKNIINGWIIINKPGGMTSTKVVSIVRRLLSPLKIGHAGTLDPLATGVLPLALGEATKTINYMMDAEKAYDFTVKFGEETDSSDSEGKVVFVSDKMPEEQQIIDVLPEFLGKIEQVPPIYSAIKINGRRAYELAREGQEFDITPREVTIYDLQLKGLSANSADFSVKCSKGTYVRSLARDIARKLGSRGHVTVLKRTKVGKFSLEDTILLESLEKSVYKDASNGFLLPIEAVLDDIPVLALGSEDADKLRQGQVIRTDKIEGIFSVKSEGKLVAIAEVSEGILKSRRVFNL